MQEMCYLATLMILGALFQLKPAVAAPTEVSHEDIRDAILSLVTIFKDNSDKLERHEYRERQLGEQLKKALAGLDKRYRNQDQAILQISERLKNIERNIQQKEEQEQLQILKMSHSIETIKETLTKVTKDLEGSTKGLTAAYTVQDDPSITSRLDDIKAVLKEESQSIKETKTILKEVYQKINEGGSHSRSIGVADDILGNLLTMGNTMKQLPSKWEIQELMNDTRDTLQDIRDDIIANDEKGSVMIVAKLGEQISSLTVNQEEIIKTSSEIQSMTESFSAGVSNSYDQLLKEIKGLSKVEQVMIQTADNVMDTKRRIEYGVHQILLEVGDLVKLQGKTLNGTVNRRFDDIESTILDNQTGALSNLTSTIEQEISQVWRQIGIMYQQLTASATALDRLQQQTDAYVNGSVKTMDSMEGKVGMITSRMTEVDENLNFLLGRLSMVTSEYNQIKQGLSEAIDNMHSNFLEVKSKLKDVGPGPRPIAQDPDTENNVQSG